MLKQKKTIAELLEEWKVNSDRFPQIEHIHTTEEKEAVYASFPTNMHASIRKALESRGYTFTKDKRSMLLQVGNHLQP